MLLKRWAFATSDEPLYLVSFISVLSTRKKNEKDSVMRSHGLVDRRSEKLKKKPLAIF